MTLALHNPAMIMAMRYEITVTAYACVEDERQALAIASALKAVMADHKINGLIEVRDLAAGVLVRAELLKDGTPSDASSVLLTPF